VRYGLCLNMDAKDRWGVGYERIGQLAKIGYDYVELPLAQMLDMPDSAFEQEVLERLEVAGIPCGACNNLFPAGVRLTGPGVDAQQISDYAERAMSLAGRVGASVVVMGSSGARNLDAGVMPASGFRQLAKALSILAPAAKKRGIRIAIEPLNRLESNILNSYISALYLAALSGQPNVGALVDGYHFGMVNEPMDDLLIEAPGHVHYAELLHRALPQHPAPFGRAFFRHLKESGYSGTVSAEGYAGADFEHRAALALDVLRELGA
jgi:D-psicose/D-tagatose/L-ribulose 3-epimerase